MCVYLRVGVWVYFGTCVRMRACVCVLGGGGVRVFVRAYVYVLQCLLVRVCALEGKGGGGFICFTVVFRTSYGAGKIMRCCCCSAAAVDRFCIALFPALEQIRCAEDSQCCWL